MDETVAAGPGPAAWTKECRDAETPGAEEGKPVVVTTAFVDVSGIGLEGSEMEGLAAQSET